MARKNIEAIQFHVPDGMKQRILDHAQSQGFEIYSDYLRYLIERDMREYNKSIDLTVSRGKYDRSKSKR